MFQEDQEDLKPGLHGVDWRVVRLGDDARIQPTRELYNRYRLAPCDLDPSNDSLLAHEMRVVALAQSEKGATWLVAATEDRFSRAIGCPKTEPCPEWRLPG